MSEHNPSLRNCPECGEDVIGLRAALARIEQIAKAFDISMGGEETFHPLAPPIVKQIRDIAREALDRDRT